MKSFWKVLVNENAAVLGERPGVKLALLVGLAAIAVAASFVPLDALAGSIRIPGEDASDRLEAAGTLLRIIDTGLFAWGARLFAGLLICSAAWSLKEQRFGFSIICVVGAILFGTAPKWVKNIFEIGGGDRLFSMTAPVGDEGGAARA